MKRILILCLFFLCSFCRVESTSLATTWAGTASNQAITRTAMNNLWDTYSTNNGSGYYPWCEFCTIPSNSLQLITRAYFEANYLTGVGPYLINTSKTSSQLLVKSDIGIKAIDCIRTTGTGDCSGFGSYITLYFNSTLTKAYTDAAQTTLFNGGGNAYICITLYVSSNIAYFVIDSSGNISSLQSTTC
jgi:hypothetical protein